MAQKITYLVELLEISRCRLVVQTTLRGNALKDSQDANVDNADERATTSAGAPNMSISEKLRPRQPFGDTIRSSMQVSMLGFTALRGNGSGIFSNVSEYFSGVGGRDIGGHGGSGGGGRNDGAGGEDGDGFGRGMPFIAFTVLLASLGYFIHFIARGCRPDSVWLRRRSLNSHLLWAMRNGHNLKSAGSKIRNAKEPFCRDTEAPFCRNDGSSEMGLADTTRAETTILACSTPCDTKSIHMPSSANVSYGLETRTDADVQKFAARANDGSGADFRIKNGPPISTICNSAKNNGSDSAGDDTLNSGEAIDCGTGVQVGHFPVSLNRCFACRLTCISPPMHCLTCLTLFCPLSLSCFPCLIQRKPCFGFSSRDKEFRASQALVSLTGSF